MQVAEIVNHENENISKTGRGDDQCKV